MPLLRILLLVALLPSFGLSQNFAYVIEDFPDYNDGISSINISGDDFFFFNSRSNSSPFVYSFSNSGELQWRNNLPFIVARDFIVENDTLVFFKGSELINMSTDLGNILPNEDFSLNQEGGRFYFGKVDSFYVVGSTDWSGSGQNSENWDRVCSYLGNDDFQFCHTTYGSAFGAWIEAVTNDNNGNVYFVVNSNGDGDVNRILKMDLDQNFISTFDVLFNGSGSLPVSSKITTTQEYLVAIHNVHGGPTIDFTYYNFDGQLVYDIDFHNPHESVIEIIGCENNDVAILGYDNNLSRYNNTGELIWEHDLTFIMEGSPVFVGLWGLEELSNGSFVIYGRLDESSVVFTVDSDGCFSDEECGVIEIGECIACDLFTVEFDPKDLEVQCDNDGDYLLEIFNWINSGGMVGFFSDIDDLSIDYTWSGSYEVGTHEVTFNFEIPSINFQESYVVELVIEPNKDSPKIISDPEPLTILEAEFLYESVQEWLDQSGNMEVKHNCGTYELSHDFSYEYYQGFHLVEFTATADNGKKSTRTATLHIAGDWISQVDETHSVEIILAPNPVEDILNISGVVNQSNWKIYSLIGEDVLFGDSSESELSINVSNLSDGVYYIELSMPFNNQKVVKRFLKI